MCATQLWIQLVVNLQSFFLSCIWFEGNYIPDLHKCSTSSLGRKLHKIHAIPINISLSLELLLKVQCSLLEAVLSNITGPVHHWCPLSHTPLVLIRHRGSKADYWLLFFPLKGHRSKRMCVRNRLVDCRLNDDVKWSVCGRGEGYSWSMCCYWALH